jgi:dTDP-4-amino-4,6-dideoxygalactose transaminase
MAATVDLRDLKTPIPFNRSATVGKELQYVAEAMMIGQIAGNHAFTRKCEDLLTKLGGHRKALLTTSCTHALEMSALLLDLQPGDEVILPSFTFVSTANAYALRGAKPIFADSRADTVNLDETKLEALFTPRTKAVVVVHYAGVACEMDRIADLCKARGVALIEDNAHGLFGKYRGRPLGSIGDFATLSFHETKNITCGEGGALGVNAAKYLDRAEILREKGTNRSQFFRGMVDKYTWVDIGSSYVMSDLLAAFLYGQLEQWHRVQDARKQLWERYHLHLASWCREQGVRQPTVPAHCDQAYHMYYLVCPSLEFRTAFLEHLKKQGVLAVFHYQALHLSTMGRQFGGEPGQCPVSESLADTLVRLPFFNEMTREEQQRAVDAVTSFRGP